VTDGDSFSTGPLNRDAFTANGDPRDLDDTLSRRVFILIDPGTAPGLVCKTRRRARARANFTKAKSDQSELDER